MRTIPVVTDTCTRPDNRLVRMTATTLHQRSSWLPMLVIALVQIQMAFNVSALVISMGAIVDDFQTSPTTIATALVVYSLGVAAFVMLGARIATILGARLVFQVSVIVHGVSMAIMAVATGPVMMLLAQLLAGLAAAAAVPTLVVMIATHYREQQQQQALGLLGAAQAIAGVGAFLIVGFLGTIIGWRWPFGLLAVLAAANLALSFRLQNVRGDRSVRIDWIGAALAGVAIILISIGVDRLNDWGLLVAKDAAPFEILRLSPAFMMTVAGIICAQAFFSWLNKRREQGKPRLFAQEILEAPGERAATVCLLIVAALGPAVNFLIPLYIQIIQGRDSMATAIAIIPYTLAIFAAATFVVRLYSRLSPRHIARFGFITMAIGLFLFSISVANSWGNLAVILSLVVMGLGEGALLTLMFNVLVSASPASLAGHVGALRGTVNNLATGLGTAFASLLAVGLLAFMISSSLTDHPTLPPELISRVNLDNVDFLTNEELYDRLSTLTTDPQHLAEAKRINEDARLTALKMSVLVLAALSLFGIVPAGGLPGYKPGELPAELDDSDLDDPLPVRAPPNAGADNEQPESVREGVHA